MNTAISPLAATGTEQWLRIDNATFAGVSRKELSYLYIGQDAEGHFSTYFSAGKTAANLLEAQLMIEKSSVSHLADTIIVDIPLDKIELSRFVSFLKARGFANRTTIIYSAAQLDAPKIKFLKQAELVDDVMDLDNDEINYANKVTFLKKIKTRQGVLNVSGGKAVNQPQLRENVLYTLGKRSIDVTLASVALLLASPVMLLIAIAIKFDSRGNIFYCAPRAGRGFRVFKFFKFRTMVAGADTKIAQLAHLNQYNGADGKAATFMKISNDPRVTKLGAFLRNTSLDELPQLLNVIKGDMSIVGNRPLPLYEAAALTTNESVERFNARAGITGLWQISKRGKEDMSSEERINLDIAYARKANLGYDLWLMAKTPAALFQKSNV